MKPFAAIAASIAATRRSSINGCPTGVPSFIAYVLNVVKSAALSKSNVTFWAIASAGTRSRARAATRYLFCITKPFRMNSAIGPHQCNSSTIAAERG